MSQSLPNLVTFEEFIEWYPSNGVRYELHKGVIVEMPPPTGEHENVVGFLAAQIISICFKIATDNLCAPRSGGGLGGSYS